MSTNFIAQAKEPGRSSGSMTLSWGLLNIPLSVFTGTQETRVARKEFVDGDVDKPAGRAVIDKTSGEVVESRRVVRMAEASTGQFVVLDDDEISACTGTKGVAEVLTFVPNSDILQYVPEKLMQVRPHRTKGIPDPAASKAFSLFVTALASQNVSALVRVALRGPAQYALVTATGDLVFVHSTEGVRKPLPMGLVPVTAEEQRIAGDLISTIGITTCPKLPDVTAGKVTEYVEKKAKGAPVVTPSAGPATQVVDIMAELTASIANAKTTAKWDAPSGSPVNV